MWSLRFNIAHRFITLQNALFGLRELRSKPINLSQRSIPQIWQYSNKKWLAEKTTNSTNQRVYIRKYQLH